MRAELALLCATVLLIVGVIVGGIAWSVVETSSDYYDSYNRWLQVQPCQTHDEQPQP